MNIVLQVRVNLQLGQQNNFETEGFLKAVII